MELGLPQSWIINKGNYPIYLYFGLEEDYKGRIAYSELVIKDEIPAYWEFSLIKENLLADEFERKINGLGIVKVILPIVMITKKPVIVLFG